MKQRYPFTVKLCGVLLLFALTGYAQQPRLKNSIGISYTTLRNVPHDQYIGAGVEYRFMFRKSLGLQLQASHYPQRQAESTSFSGGTITQAGATLLAGHTWGRVALLGEGGFGVFAQSAFTGVDQNGAIFKTRKFPDFQMGGMLEVSLNRHWSLTYQVRDNLLLIGSFAFNGSPNYAVDAARQQNSPEGRGGVAFHF